jgi:hypothetical protein
VEWLFTEIFNCRPATARQSPDRTSLLPGPTQTPLACAINKIQGKSNNGQDHEYSSKQHQGRQHLLDEIDLQGDKRREPEPHPLAGFAFAESFSETLCEFH